MMYIEDETNRLKIFFVIFAICMVLAFLFSGCNTFKANITKDMTPECKDFYYVLEYYSDQKIDSAFVGTVYTECKSSRSNKKDKLIKSQQAKIEEICGKLYSDKDEYKRCLK